MSEPSAHRLQSVEIDDQSLSAVSRDQEQERQVAVFDLLEENYFAPDGADGGPRTRVALQVVRDAGGDEGARSGGSPRLRLHREQSRLSRGGQQR